ncbi:unnamed protein product [Discosporangium mesarthrocarpum]
MLRAGLLEPVVSETRNALDPKAKKDHETIRFCLLVLANLSVSRENHGAIMRECLPTLAGFSKHRDIKARQHAVFALGNVCANPDNLEAVVESGALKTLITYAFPSTDTSINVQFQAVAALRGIATHQTLRMQVVREGGLEPLVLAARSDSVEVQRETAATLANLALAEENKVAMARSGALPALSHLCDSGDRERQIHAVAAMANVAEMVEGRTQKRMIEEGCLRPLLRLVDSPEVEVREEASRALALFASKRDSQAHMVACGAVPKLVSFVRGSDTGVRRYGVLGLGNLAVVTQNHQTLFDGGGVSSLLMENVYGADDLETRRCVAFALNNIAAFEPNHRACERLGVLRPLVKLLRDPDQDTHLQAAFAIRQLSVTARCRSQLVEMKGLNPLLRLGASDSAEVLREVAAALRNVSLSEHSKIDIVKEGGLTVLVEMMHSADIETAHQATGVVANLGEVVENQGKMVESGILQHLKFVMRSKSVDVQREAVRGVANISAEYAYTAVIAGAGAIVPLVAMLSSPDFLCQRYAAMGVGNLATNLSNQEKILHEGALQPLTSLAKRDNGDLESQRYAVFALTNVAATRSNHARLIDAGVCELVSCLMEADDVEIRNSSGFCVSNFASNPDNHATLLAEGVLGPLINLVATSDPQAQLRAASALRGLSVDEAIRTEIVARGGLAPLLRLSGSDDVEIQMEVLAALCNLSLSGCIGEDPVRFLRAVDVNNLVSFLCSADVTYRLFGAVTLGNIASDVSLQAPIVRGGALTPLITIANAADLETQRCIAYSLCNLSADPSRRPTIVNEGGLPPLVSLACSDHPVDQRAALATLRAIAADPEYRRAVVEAGALEAVSLGARCEDSLEVRQEAARVLFALSLNELNKLDIAGVSNSPTTAAGVNGDTATDLISLARSGDVICARHAVGALANLSENETTHNRLLGWGAKFLSQLALYGVGGGNSGEGSNVEDGEGEWVGKDDSSEGSMTAEGSQDIAVGTVDVGLMREITRCLANLAGNYATHPLLVEGAAAEALVLNMKREDALTTRFAVLGLANLAAQSVNHSKICLAGAIKPLVQLATGERRSYILLRDDGTPDVEGMADPIREPKHDEEIIRLLGYDVDSRRYACLALGQLAAATSNHEEIISKGGIEALRSSLDPDDDETVFNAAYALNKLAMNENNHETMGEKGVSPPLVLVIDIREDTNIIGQAVSTLRRMATNSDNAIAMVQDGVLEALQGVCEAVGSVENQREAAALLCALSIPFENKLPLAHSTSAGPLMHMCQSTDVEVARLACGAVANAAEDSSTHPAFLSKSNAIHYMVFLMRSRHLSVHREASRACGNLLTSIEAHRDFVSEDGLRSLLLVATSLDDECQYNAAIIYRKICADVGTHDYIVGRGGLQALLGLVQLRSARTQRQAAAALRDICSNKDHKVTVAGEGGLRALIALSRCDDLELRILASGALRHLSLNTRVKRPMLEEGALGPILRFVDEGSDSLDLLCQCAGIIGNLSEDARNQVSLVKDGIMPRLVKLGRVNHEGVKADVSRAYASISSNAECQVGVFGTEDLQAIFLLAGSEEEKCSRDAAMTLGNLAVVTRNQEAIVVAGGLVPLVKMLAVNRYLSCQKFAARALYRLAAHGENQHKMAAGGALPPLIRTLRSPDAEVARFSAMALCNLSSYPDCKASMVSLHSLPPLLDMLSGDADLAKRYAAMTLCNLSTLAANQVHIVKAGALLCLVELTCLGREKPDISRYCGMTLSNLACNRQNRVPIVEAGGLAPLCNMAFDGERLEMQRAAGLALYNLSCAAANQLRMVNSGCPAALIKLTSCPDVDCKRFAIMTLCNLTANAETRSAATKGGGLQAAVRLTKDDDGECRRYAATCVCNMANDHHMQA